VRERVERYKKHDEKHQQEKHRHKSDPPVSDPRRRGGSDNTDLRNLISSSSKGKDTKSDLKYDIIVIYDSIKIT
jgi:hypothetical protein